MYLSWCQLQALCAVPRAYALYPDTYAFRPLYGAYGPYRGTGYWGAYTLSGWGGRWWLHVVFSRKKTKTQSLF